MTCSVGVSRRAGSRQIGVAVVAKASLRSIATRVVCRYRGGRCWIGDREVGAEQYEAELAEENAKFDVLIWGAGGYEGCWRPRLEQDWRRR